jgi:hypothetical protein
MIVGYARATDSQTLDAQQSALAAAGAERVFAEKVSGAITDRKALAKAIAALGARDVLLVTRLDRLARSTRDLLNVLDAVSKAGAGFRSLADAWADTTSAHGRLMLTVLGGLAEFERELIKARTAEAGSSPRGTLRPEAQAHSSPNPRSARATGSWRGPRGNRPELQRQSQHDQSACGGVAPSELADGSSAPANSNPIQRRNLGGTGDVG